jgi:CRP/FNR family transcriptional regulator
LTGADAELVRRAELFAGLPPGDADAFLAVAHEHELEAGSTLIREGERGARVLAFFIVLAGEVAIEVGGRRIAARGPGDYLGEVALLNDTPRTATVTAMTDVRCLALSAWDFRRFAEKHPETAERLRQHIAARASDTAESAPG